MDRHPLWFKDAIIYEVHVRAFYDSNGDGIGDLVGLRQKLRYVADLGVTAIWLLPFYPSPLRDGGYDIADYKAIHPSYGTIDDFRHLLDEAHSLGLRVITELVMNHTSADHPWFQRARQAPVDSAERNFYVWSDTADRYAAARIIFRDFETSNWTWDPVARQYYWHRFYSHQPDLNFDNPAVHDALFDVVDFWLGMGVDGLRLDAIPYLYEREGTNCENLPETHAFLKKLRAHVDARYADRMLLAEANQWPEDAAAYFGDGDECHMNFHFPLMPRMFQALHTEDSFPVIDILRQTPAIPESCGWATFLRNHDELTLEMVTEEARDAMWRAFASHKVARINLGIRRRLAPLLGSRDRLELLVTLLVALPGTPVLYYGDEIGMGDNVYLGDRDGVRTPMQWSADRNAGFSRANSQQLYLPVVVDSEYHYEAVNVEAQQASSTSLLWWTKRLLAMRTQNEVLSRGDFDVVETGSAKVFAFIRRLGERAVLIVANLSRFAQCAHLDLSPYAGRMPVELVGGTPFPRVGREAYFLSLAPHGVFMLDLAVEEAPALTSRPIFRVQTRWDEVFDAKHAPALADALLRFARDRRWFRSKRRTPVSTRVHDVIRLPTGGPPRAVVTVDVTYNEGDPETYVVPLLFRSGATEGTRPETMVARVESARASTVPAVPAAPAAEDIVGVLEDALMSDDVAQLVVEGFRLRTVLEGKVGKLSFLPRPAFDELAPMGRIEGPRRGDLEQTNTTVIIGDRFVLKLFRVLERGTSVEVEMLERLAVKGFPNVPRFAGEIAWSGADDRSTIAVLTTFVPSQGDAWMRVTDEFGRVFEHALASPAEAVGLAPDDLFAPRDESASRVLEALSPELFQLARALGVRLGELHMALLGEPNDPVFGGEPYTTFHRRSIQQAAHERAERLVERLARGKYGEGAPTELIERLVRARDAIRVRLRRVLDLNAEFVRIRTHGDLHLGQVLVVGDDVVFIDFEGEPARPIEERRHKRAGLRDVAGLVRSFDYAASHALRASRIRPEDQVVLRPHAKAFATWASAALVSAYTETVRNTPLLPARAEDASLLLDFLIMEKCLYEVAYELDHRPTWVDVPLESLLERLGV